MGGTNPFERAQLIETAMARSDAIYRDRMRALSLGVEGLQSEYAAGRIDLDELERWLPAAIEVEEWRGGTSSALVFGGKTRGIPRRFGG